MDYLTWVLRCHDELTPEPPAMPEAALRSVLWFRGRGDGESAAEPFPAGEEEAVALPGAETAFFPVQSLLERLRAGQLRLHTLSAMERGEASAAVRSREQTEAPLHRLTPDGGMTPLREQDGMALSVEEISRYFERDARRY